MEKKNMIALFLMIVIALARAADPTDNVFYVLLSSSKFYFNYRHTGNTLAIYHHLKAMGVTDDRIILMLPENHGCNPRNQYPG